MPYYQDKKTKKWSCRFYYTDNTGKRLQKKKCGFNRLCDAKQWERDFLARVSGSPDMPFSELAKLYLQDKKRTAKISSYESMENRIRNWLLPSFGDRPISEITPAELRSWQLDLKDVTGSTGKPLAPSYMNNIINQLSVILNYGVRYYGLSSNPMKIAGNIVGKKAKSLNFWTKQQFEAFISTFDKKDPYYTFFMILYYTGMRKGELQALTPADIDLSEGSISVNKTVRVVDGIKHIMPPKTPKSERIIVIPGFLCDVIRDYESRFYKIDPDEMIFYVGRSSYRPHLNKHADQAGIPRIRVHDLRHSHASLLVDLGFSAVLIAERLGHEDVSTTLNIYSHLFPSRQKEVAEKLQNMFSEKEKPSTGKQ